VPPTALKARVFLFWALVSARVAWSWAWLCAKVFAFWFLVSSFDFLYKSIFFWSTEAWLARSAASEPIELLGDPDGGGDDGREGGGGMRDPPGVLFPTRALLLLPESDLVLREPAPPRRPWPESDFVRAPATPRRPGARRLMHSGTGTGAANDAAEAPMSAMAMVVVRESFIASVE
ncbi:hypothetical protein K437DRAFT_85235, partial [Tilletiaria anomala UBC 951]